jgi:hypothetical protein
MGRFDYNQGFDRQAANMEETKDLLEALGDGVLADVATASTRFYRTGDWEEHLDGDLRDADGWPFYRVEDSSEDAVYIEFGTSKTPAHRALGQAIGKTRAIGAVTKVKRTTKKQGRKAMQQETALKAEAKNQGG